MRFRSALFVAALCAVLGVGLLSCVPVRAQGAGSTQSGATAYQRLEVARQRLDAMRRSLSTALANMGSDGKEQKDKKDKQATATTAANDAATRLRGLDKEVGSLLSEVAELRGKVDRSERYDPTAVDKIESALSDLNDRVEAALRETASTRRGGPTIAKKSNNKKKGSLFGRLLGRGGGDSEIDELTGTVAPGRDRELFAAGSKHARKGDYEGARLLFSVIINTYPESQFLPYAKLAIADTFYLEGTTSALIQGGAAYQDWLTYFPTDPLAERAMLKIAEVEMRQMGLPDRSIDHAHKAEQRLKAAMQQFPQTSLRPEFELRLREVQENLADHSFNVGRFYEDRFNRQLANNLKGAQSRYREVYEKYPNYSGMAEVLFRLGVSYVQEEEPDEAAKYFQLLVRRHPSSVWAEKAKEQLQAIGAPIPEPDKDAVKDEPVKPGLMDKFGREVLGNANVTVDKDGVLISHDSKETADLIEQVLANNGALPTNALTGPTPSPRLNLKPRPAPVETPAQPKTNGDGLKVQPTKPGAPATGSDPTKPSAPPPGR
ncbi:MAG: outer membrane protein assembly factor BamD [Pyrinomonadaceae bacterium]